MLLIFSKLCAFKYNSQTYAYFVVKRKNFIFLTKSTWAFLLLLKYTYFRIRLHKKNYHKTEFTEICKFTKKKMSFLKKGTLVEKSASTPEAVLKIQMLNKRILLKLQ